MNFFFLVLSMKALLSNSNSLIVVILSHGLEGDMIMASDAPFHLYDLIQMFTPDEVPEMATRPKIFIIQSCRGKKLDSGIILKRDRSFSVDSVDAVIQETPFKYPSHADICIALSSHHGHASFRNIDGTWFIQDMCDVLETINLTTNHLMDVFTSTNRKVAARASSSTYFCLDDKKQVSSVYTTFTQKFYLKNAENNSSGTITSFMGPRTMEILVTGLFILNIFIFYSKK